VSAWQIRQAARQWRGEQRARPSWMRYRFSLPIVIAGLLGSAALVSAYVDEWPGKVVTTSLDNVPMELATQPQGSIGPETNKVAPTAASVPVVRSSEKPAAKVVNDVPMQFIGPGSPPEAVRWLRHELDRIEGIASQDDSPVFDERLRQRVMVLQRNHGLVADGLAGPQTLNALHENYGTEVFPQYASSQTRS